ncbi:MAG: aldo/keto reductase [bacterium]
MNLINNEFKIAKDAVDPKQVPKRKLYTGAEIPGIGFGTFGSDHVSAEKVAKTVFGAVEVGYRHFDCAAAYHNEKEIGEAFDKITKVVEREDLWITSKLWNDSHGKGNVIPACKKSLDDLGLEYLDLYLVHWPFPNYHAPGVDVDSRDPDAEPYIHEHFMETWREMEKLVEMGLVKHIGTSNMTIPKLQLLLKDAKIKPVANEMELHPHFQQDEFFEYCQENEILPIGFTPIGSPNRPERDRTENDTVDIEDPVIVKIAEDHDIHPAVVCVKWAVQRGQVPLPFSTNRDNYLNNLRASVEDPLTKEEMKKIANLNKKCRLIKGQVFLWEEAEDWHDLWDENGEIASR